MAQVIEATDRDIVGVCKAQIKLDLDDILYGDEASITCTLESLLNLVDADGSWPPLLDSTKDLRIGDVGAFEAYQ